MFSSMFRTRTWPVQWLLILFAALLVSSCVSVAAESEFDADGGAVYSIQVTLDTTQLGALADLGGIDLEDQFSFGGDAERRAEALGYTFETIQEDNLIGFRATKEDAEAANVASDLNQMFSVGTESVTGFSPFSGTFTQDGDTYTLDLTVDGEQLSFANIGDSINIPDLGFGGFNFENILEITYTAKMPGEIQEDETNGRILSDSRVRWDIPTSGTEQLTAVSSTGSDDDFPLLLVLGVSSFCVMALALLALLIIILLMRRRPGPEAPQPAAPPSPPPAPISPAPIPAAPFMDERELSAEAVTAQLPSISTTPAEQSAEDAPARESPSVEGDQSTADVASADPDDTPDVTASDDQSDDAGDEDSADTEENKNAPADGSTAG